MRTASKRSASPILHHLENNRRPRFLTAKTKSWDKSTSNAAAPIDGPVQQGQEFLSLSPSLPQDLRHDNLNDLILSTTAKLASEGKRLVSAPRLLPDGIAFDWIADATARHEEMKKLLSVEGIRTEDLERVLRRATPVPNGPSIITPAEASTTKTLSIESTSDPQKLEASSAPRHGLHVGDASDPIIVDDDDEEVPAPFNNQEHGDRNWSAPQTDVDECLFSLKRRQEDRNRDHDTPIPYSCIRAHSHDRSSVDTRATRLCSPELSNVIQGQEAAIPTRVMPSDHAGTPDSCHSQNPPSPGASRSEVQAELRMRTAAYGKWKAFEEDSSDLDSDPGRQSSRESSVAPSVPLQPSPPVVPGLQFLPRTYDTSNLFSHQSSGVSVPDSRTGSSRDIEPEVLPLLRRRPYQPPSSGPGSSTERTAADSPPRQSIRQNPVQIDPSSRASSDDSDVEKTAQGASSRSAVASRVYSTARGAQRSRRKPRSTARSASEFNQGSSSSSPVVEHERRHAPASMDTSGDTVVIPKAYYARARRLLAPVNADRPIATVLMRGEVHFLDQRRKTRISTYGLPVEEDRHVDDACLIGDETVVIGYNKGPYQVSLIPVDEDQRPYRIDLSFKAHSTVIESPATGKSCANPGIACLAPVSHQSFLSGGYDKTVQYWRVARQIDRSQNHASFSASATRIPTEHAQSVHALAYGAWNDTVYSAAGDRIVTTKLTAFAPSESERVSGNVTQIHVHPQDPRLIALEIDHMDYQVHFYDMRERGFKGKPWLEFGYRSVLPTASRTSTTRRTSRCAGSPNVPKSGSRYTRGSTSNSLFARGYADGAVLVWDYRNGAQKKVLERFQFHRPAEVVHTVLAGSDVIAYGGYSVTFWSTLSGRA